MLPARSMWNETHSEVLKTQEVFVRKRVVVEFIDFLVVFLWEG